MCNEGEDVGVAHLAVKGSNMAILSCLREEGRRRRGRQWVRRGGDVAVVVQCPVSTGRGFRFEVANMTEERLEIGRKDGGPPLTLPPIQVLSWT